MVLIRLTTMGQSKSQYETQFLKWNLKKNHTHESWQQLARILLCRNLDRKKIEILFQDRVIGADKVERQLDRYGQIPNHELAIGGKCEIASLLVIYQYLSSICSSRLSNDASRFFHTNANPNDTVGGDALYTLRA